uniref:Uncharacterized protein n=1 Tax=mine drainage metagenome TaxID=410659 RepID=E6QJC6_9ZZZZ
MHLPGVVGTRPPRLRHKRRIGRLYRTLRCIQYLPRQTVKLWIVGCSATGQFLMIGQAQAILKERIEFFPNALDARCRVADGIGARKSEKQSLHACFRTFAGNAHLEMFLDPILILDHGRNAEIYVITSISTDP